MPEEAPSSTIYSYPYWDVFGGMGDHRDRRSRRGGDPGQSGILKAGSACKDRTFRLGSCERRSYEPGARTEAQVATIDRAGNPQANAEGRDQGGGSDHSTGRDQEERSGDGGDFQISRRGDFQGDGPGKCLEAGSARQRQKTELD